MTTFAYGLDALNLDAMEVEDLDQLAEHLKSLRLYAETKAGAMRSRLGGRIDAALVLENECERIYRSLPDSWKW